MNILGTSKSSCSFWDARYPFLPSSYFTIQARIQGGGALGPAPTPGTEGPAPKARVPSSQGQKEGTLVFLE